ncbi:MAG TPA: response regulator transcription factor [Actinomycetota bacterium]
MIAAPVRVAVTNDFELVVAGLARMLEPFAERVSVVAQPVRGAPVPSPVDVALFDTFGHPNSGYDEILRLRADPNVERVAVFTWDFDPKFLDRALGMGVTGYLGKNLSAAELVDALERVAAGERVVTTNPATDRHAPPGRSWPGRETGLSERESEVLILIAEGLSNVEIATALHISVNSVKSHVRNGYRKLGVRTRAQAVRTVLERSMIRRSMTPTDADGG